MTGRWRVLAILACAAGLVDPGAAQTYPERLIRVVVPYPPGGPIDTTARLVTQRVSVILGRTVIIENRGGGGGAIGTKFAIGAEPDGYTLLFGNASVLAVLPGLMRSRGEPLGSFAAVAKVTEGYEVLVVDAAGPVRSVADLVATAKANPGKLNYGSAGVTNLTHLTAELFKQRTAIDIVHVPYKSNPEAIQAMLAGQVQMMFGEVAGLLPHVRDGRLRALGVASQTRNALAPELPTMAEGGMPGFVAPTFTGIVASAGTPPPVVATLNRAINEALASPEVRAALERLGAEVRPDTPEAFAEFLAGQQAKWDDVMQRSGIRLD